jgi:hypothetical protein
MSAKEKRVRSSYTSAPITRTEHDKKKKAKYVGLRFHDLRRPGIRSMSRKGIPENAGMLISGHRTKSVYRRYSIIDMEVIKCDRQNRRISACTATQDNRRTATASSGAESDDKTDSVN